MTRQNALRCLNKLRTGKTKYIRADTLEKHFEFFSQEEIDEIIDLNSKNTETQIQVKILDYHKFIEPMLNNDKSNVNTVNKRQYQLNGIQELFNLDIEDILNIHEPEEIIDRIKKQYTYPEDYLNLFNLIFTLNKDVVPDETKENFKKATTNLKNITTVDKLIQRFTDKTDYKELYEELTTPKEHTNDNMKIIHSLYTDGIFNNKNELTMVPRGYFYNTRIGNFKDTDGNWYNPRTGRLNIVNFKTDGNYSYNYLLPLNVRALINESLTKHPREYLIVNQKLEPYTPNVFNRLVKKSLNGIEIQDYRKIVENYFIQSNIDRLDLAKAMGHSVDTQLLSYVNNENNQKQLEKNSQSQSSNVK